MPHSVVRPIHLADHIEETIKQFREWRNSEPLAIVMHPCTRRYLTLHLHHRCGNEWPTKDEHIGVDRGTYAGVPLGDDLSLGWCEYELATVRL